MEAAIAFEAQTRIALGGPRTDLFNKATFLQVILRNVQVTCDIRKQGDTCKSTFAQLFDSRHTRCARDITGVWLSGISRRPVWKEGEILEELISLNLALARQHFDEYYSEDLKLAVKNVATVLAEAFTLN